MSSRKAILKNRIRWEEIHKRKGHRIPGEEFLENLLLTFTEASYEIAVRLGFHGDFLNFLSDFQDSVQALFERSGWGRSKKHSKNNTLH